MGKKLVYFIIFLVALSLVKADYITDAKQEIDNATLEISSFFYDIPKQDFKIVTGSRISVEERLLFNLMKSSMSQAQGTEIEPDSHTIIDNDYNTLILIGSARTNLLSKKLLEEDKALKLNTSVHPPVVIDFLKLGDGKKAIILYSQKEILNNENTAAEKSFLSKFIDKKYVPVAATFVSLLLLYLWSIFGKTLLSIISDLASSKVITKVTKDKKVKKKHLHELKLHEFMMPSEIIAYLVSVVVFSLVMSYSYSSDLIEFKKMILLNLLVVAGVTIIREAIRLFYCYKEKIRTQFVFWPFGTIITFVSTFLGNTFSLVSYTLVDTEHQDEKKFGKISFLISIFTLISAYVSYLINILMPSLFMQMIFVYCIMVVFIELFPISPMAGADIKKWNRFTWLILYFIAVSSYILMNFSMLG
jgi:hypothetical protein